MSAFRDNLVAIQPMLLGYAINLTHGSDLAEDLVQQASLKMLEHEHTYREQGYFASWACLILRNMWFSEGRRRAAFARHTVRVSSEDSFGVQPPDQDRVVELDELSKSLDKLRPEHRQVLIDVDLLGMSYEEAGAKMGVGVQTVKSRVWRAREAAARSIYGVEDPSKITYRKPEPVGPSSPTSGGTPILVPWKPAHLGPKVDPSSKRQQRLQKMKMLERLRGLRVSRSGVGSPGNGWSTARSYGP